MKYTCIMQYSEFPKISPVRKPSYLLSPVELLEITIISVSYHKKNDFLTSTFDLFEITFCHHGCFYKLVPISRVNYNFFNDR